MSGNNKILPRLKKLTPTEFEHLVFDLLILSGLKNVVWRTPGADGGRDLEGYFTVNDFSENLKLEHWYIECKRYEHSIDWPTVYKKVSYADNHNADFLFLVTTSYISPKCKEEIANWLRNRKRPIIRYWDGTTLEQQILRYPVLLYKYSLLNPKPSTGVEFLAPITFALKTITSAYNTAVFSNSLSSDLELCAALVDLISARIDESKQPGKAPKRRFLPHRDLHHWCDIDNKVDLTPFDSFGMRAVLAAIKFCGRIEEIIILPSTDGICKIPLDEANFTEVLNNILTQASIHSNIEFHYKDAMIVLSLRKE
jgi:hypothetical protein